jgi:porphyrinogen peroxidase
VRERGLYFIAFSAERAHYDVLLGRMLGTSEDGVSDRLTEFSRPVTGACYFAPSLNALAEVGGSE